MIGEERIFDTPAGITLLKGYRPEKFVEDPRRTSGNEIQSVTELVRAIAAAGHNLAKAPEPPALPAAGRPTVTEIVARASR